MSARCDDRSRVPASLAFRNRKTSHTDMYVPPADDLWERVNIRPGPNAAADCHCIVCRSMNLRSNFSRECASARLGKGRRHDGHRTVSPAAAYIVDYQTHLFVSQTAPEAWHASPAVHYSAGHRQRIADYKRVSGQCWESTHDAVSACLMARRAILRVEHSALLIHRTRGNRGYRKKEYAEWQDSSAAATPRISPDRHIRGCRWMRACATRRSASRRSR